MKIVIFAGTSEGKAVAVALSDAGHKVTATVATDYGKDVFWDFFKNHPSITTLEGRLSILEMQQLIQQQDLVLDATHPFATEVSKNILTACETEQKDYLRIVRDAVEIQPRNKNIIQVKNIDEAIAVMNSFEDKVLMTTGSKDLAKYTQVQDYKERLYPRILPDRASLEIAEANGYKRSNIICMQGPFTAEVNAAMLRMIGAKYLITKETGGSGGFFEKLQGCEMAGASAIVIARPTEEIERHVPENIVTASCTAAELKAFLAYHKAEGNLPVRPFTVAALQDFKDTMQGIVSQADEAKEERETRLQAQNQAAVRLRFPIFIDLQDKLVTVVGSGRIAQRRIRTLLDYGAQIRIVSPRASSELCAEIKAQQHRLVLVERDYQAGDLKDALIAIAATSNRQINRQVAQDALKEKIFVSIADCKEESSFYFPAVWQGQRLSVGMVGDGQDHHYMKKSADKIRRLLKDLNLEDENEED